MPANELPVDIEDLITIDATIRVSGYEDIESGDEIDLVVGDKVNFVIEWYVNDDDTDATTGQNNVVINGGDFFRIDLSGPIMQFLGEDHYLTAESETAEDYMPLYMNPSEQTELLGHWAIISTAAGNYIHFVAHDNITQYHGRSGGFYIEGEVGQFDSENEEEIINIGSLEVTFKYGQTPPSELDGVKIVIGKTDATDPTKEISAGTEFQIKNNLYTFTSYVANKTVIFDHIPNGTYELTETVGHYGNYDVESLVLALADEAVTGITIVEGEKGVYTITIDVTEEENGKVIELDATNERSAVRFMLGKKDVNTGSSIGWTSGEFSLFVDGVETVKAERIKYSSLYYFNGLETGVKYEIREVLAPEGGYDKNTLAFAEDLLNNPSLGFTLTLEDGVYYIVFAENDDFVISATNDLLGKGHIVINKYDRETGDLIEGHTTINLKRLNEDGNYEYYRTASFNTTTKILSFSNVIPGTYLIEEHTAAPGYDRHSLVIEEIEGVLEKVEGVGYLVTVTNEGTVELNAYNTKTENGYISINKVDSQSTGTKLPSTFTLTKIFEDGSVDTSFTVMTRTTTEWLNATFVNLPVGIYEIVETAAKSGYDVNSLAFIDLDEENPVPDSLTQDAFELNKYRIVVEAGGVYMLKATNSKTADKGDALSKTAEGKDSEDFDPDGDGTAFETSRYGVIEYTIDVGYDLVLAAAKHNDVAESTYQNVVLYDELSEGQYFDTSAFTVGYEEYYPTDATGTNIYRSGTTVDLINYFEVIHQSADETYAEFKSRIESMVIGGTQKPVIAFSSDNKNLIVNLGTFGSNGLPVATDEDGAITSDAGLSDYLKDKGLNSGEIDAFLKSFGFESDAKGQALGYTFTLKVYAAPSEEEYSNVVDLVSFTKEESALVSGIIVSNVGAHITGEKDKVTITKYTEDSYGSGNQIPLEGVEFKLLKEVTDADTGITSFVDYMVDGALVTATTNSDGEATFEKLPEGKYRIIEVRTVTGYDIDSLVVYDFTGAALEGAEFTLSYELTEQAEMKFDATNDILTGGGEGSGDGGRIPRDPDEPNEPEEPTTEIPDPEVPQGELPEVDIPTVEVPLATLPEEEEIIILPEEIPLAEAPDTGDDSNLALFSFATMLSGSLLAVLACLEIKARKASKNEK